MALLFTLPRVSTIDLVGEVAPRAKLYFYATGTTTPLTVYADSGLTTPLTSPVPASDGGTFPTIYLNDLLGPHKVVCHDENDQELWSVDPYLTGPTQAQIGLALYPRTTNEVSAAVTPTNYAYPPGNVCRYGAVGNDVADCSTAFASAFAVANAVSSPVEITFPEGTYRISASQNWFKPGLTMRAIGKVTIRSTATSGYIVGFDSGTSLNGYLCNMLGDFTLDSTNAGVEYGLYTRNVHHSTFECAARNITQAGLLIQGAVLNRYKFECSDNSSGNFTTRPVNGVRIQGSAIISSTTACKFDLTIEDSTGTGVILTACDNCQFWGTAEGLDGLGLAIDAGCTGNVFQNFFCEVNGGGDIDCDGTANIFISCTASSRAATPPYESLKSIIFGAVSERNQWIGGLFYAASVESGALHNSFMGFDTDYKVEDSGTSTAIWGRQDNVSVNIRAAQIPMLDAFASLTTVNSWANTSGTFQTPQYSINRGLNEVIVRGEVGGGASGSVIATLPAGYRPSKQFTFICPATAGSADAVVNVQTDGNIQHVSGDTTSIDLGTIRFFV